MKLVIDLDIAPVELHAQGFQAEIGAQRRTSDRDQHLVGGTFFEIALIVELDIETRRKLFDAVELGAREHLNAFFLKALL